MALASGLAPLIRFARSLKPYAEGIISSATYRLNTSVLQGMKTASRSSSAWPMATGIATTSSRRSKPLFPVIRNEQKKPGIKCRAPTSLTHFIGEDIYCSQTDSDGIDSGNGIGLIGSLYSA